MSRVETLTAYRCKFSYMQRNNPLIDEYREDIKLGKQPEFTFDDFISLYIENSNDLLIGKNSDRAIELTNDRISEDTFGGIKFWHISPLAGKQGQPMTVLKRSTGKKYDFGADSAALYNYHLFVYETDNEFVAIFHRQNGSGCKSVFLETANNILKTKGIKLEMSLIVPISDKEKDITPVKLTLQCVENDPSSDVADNIKRKKIVIRDMGLNLEVMDNSPIANIIKNVQLGKISKEAAFAEIKESQGNANDFNDAELSLKIGKKTRRVSWNDFENIVGVHDITDELHREYAKSKNFVNELTKLSHKYYHDIIESGVTDDE